MSSNTEKMHNHCRARSNTNIKMLEITVKTLDGRNRTFTVNNDITVRQFKEEIATSIEIEANVQRLIFQGRVLADEKKINDYDVNGKTIHVVLRPPPQARPPPATTSTEEPRNARTVDFAFHSAHHAVPSVDLHLHMGSPDASVQSEAQNRIDQAKKMLKSAKETLDKIDNPSAEMVDNTVVSTVVREETSSSRTTTTRTVTTTNMETGQTTNETSTTTTSTGVHHSEQNQQPNPPEDPPITSLADFFDDVLLFNDTLNLRIGRFRDILRQDNGLVDLSPAEAARMKRTCELTSEAIHYMSHVYHNISDLSVDMEQGAPRRLHAPVPPPRQATAVIQQTIPVQAQFSLSPIMRESETSPAMSMTTSTTTTTTTTLAGLIVQIGTHFIFNYFNILLFKIFPPGIPQIHFAMSSNDGGSMARSQAMGNPIPGGHMFGIPIQPGQMFPMMNGGLMNFSSQTPGTTTSSSTATTTHQSSGPTSPRRNVDNPTLISLPANFPQLDFNGDHPPFLNENFLQNIIQVATNAMQDASPNAGHQASAEWKAKKVLIKDKGTYYLRGL
ncbi:hypothetical protein HELRODRAFT_187805 [Helobdella robusta]|uniref:BCL2-associated athanogene 6 n=1 Tax=Helobdella robusta TaxID=6412 RepID=T1FPE0_HELRO|nr:hypothetical protein HELRODRAFT_187805 [Helobdella robusta]ESO12241.1 hypothetical protein HELRODRAFT_187805 [Helobdella robusta]